MNGVHGLMEIPSGAMLRAGMLGPFGPDRASGTEKQLLGFNVLVIGSSTLSALLETMADQV